MLKVGFIGWRGMVGSVLLQQMQRNADFNKIIPFFFSTSNIGGDIPELGTGAVTPTNLGIKVNNSKLLDAYNLDLLVQLDCIVTCFGSDYTNNILPQLRAHGYIGYWLDASSALRMATDSVIVLDPVNHNLIDSALNNGIKNYVGGNCTVSLLLMALHGLLRENLIEWVTSQTYQAASGAGAANMRELITQGGVICEETKALLGNEQTDILTIDDQVTKTLRSATFPKQHFGYPLAGNVLPWIDSEMPNGQSREEWKGMVEANKILGLEENQLKIDGTCVRVSSMRCHSQALTIKLKDKNLAINTIEEIIKSGNQWVKYINNTKADTLNHLTPAAISGTLDIAIGRVRKMTIGDEYLAAFTVGDQLLWGAAEPIRRMLNILANWHRK